MSFSRSRKAAWKARVSGDSFQLYGIEEPQMSEEALWRQQSQLDLSLTIPERPQRLIIRDDEPFPRFSVPSKLMPSVRNGEGDIEKLDEPALFKSSLRDDQPVQSRPTSQGMTKPREIASLAMICMVQIIPLSALGTSFPTADVIAISFKIGDPSILPWTVAAYALTFGTFMLIVGRLGDIFGHKKMLIAGFTIMAVSSTVAGFSKYSTYVLYFIARAFQGIGSAAMQPNGLALLGRMYAPGSKKKNMAFALFGSMAALGAYLGMLFGAILAHESLWAWASYGLAILSGVCAVLAQLVFIPPLLSSLQTESFLFKVRAMDWAGGVTGVAGLACIVIACVQAPAQGWETQYVFMLLIIGVIIMTGFVVIEIEVAKIPLVPFRTLKSDVAFILGAVGLGWASFGVYIFYLWQFSMHSRLLSPMATVVQAIPVVPVGFVATALTGFLMHTTKPSLILCIALFAFTLGAVLIAVTPVAQSYWGLTFISLFVIPFGMDMSFPAATVTMSNTLLPEQQGIAGSLVATVVNYSMSLGLGIASTAQYYVDDNGVDILAGYRGAFYVSMGLGSAGILIAVTFFMKDLLRERRARHQANGSRSVFRANHCWSRLWNQVTLTQSKEQLTKMPIVKARTSERLSHIPIVVQVAEMEGVRESTDTLWGPHPAVRPRCGADLVARE